MPDKQTLEIAERIKHHRQRLSLTQSDLATRAGFEHHQQISQIENAEREVKARELLALARALRVSFTDLLPSSVLDKPHLVLWRAAAEATAEKEVAFVQRCEQYHALELLAGDVRRAHLPCVDDDPASMTWPEAAGLADDLRDALDLGSRPGASLLPVLEDRFHVKVLYDSIGEVGSAACSSDEYGMAMLINSDEAPWRRNFSSAHELFHLVTWSTVVDRQADYGPAEWEHTEKVAEAFAAALLLPAEALLSALEELVQNGELLVSDLLSLALGFNVSIDALLWRLVNLNRLDRDAVSALLKDGKLRAKDRTLRAAQWWKPESLPTRYVRLAFQAHMRDRLSLSKLAEYLDTDIAGVREKLSDFELDEYADEPPEVLPA